MAQCGNCLSTNVYLADLQHYIDIVPTGKHVVVSHKSLDLLIHRIGDRNDCDRCLIKFKLLYSLWIILYQT